MKIIANPRAGHGRGEKNVAQLARIIRRRGLDCRPVLTEHPGHATELARCAAEAAEARLVVMGGDGTVGEVVEGLVGSNTELAVVSVGTGNDVARSLGLPLNDIEAGLDVAFGGSVMAIDVGRERDRHFISVLGLGFPTIVAEAANRARWLRGPPAFFISVYKGLYRLRPAHLVIELDDQTLELESVAVMIQNTPYTGGGLHMAPGAQIDDGLLDVVVVDDIGRLDLMLNFPKVYRGKHLDHPSFTLYQSRTVRITSPEPMPKMFDGDVIGSSPLEAAVVPRSLKVVVGPSSSNGG
jgi:diacylglycerol kinase (ATP)